MRVDYKLLSRARIVRVPGRSWHAQSAAVMEILGCKKPPAAGLPARDIQGIKVWVVSLADARAKKQFHRVRCECPYCKADVSLGRLHQHVMVHASEIGPL